MKIISVIPVSGRQQLLPYTLGRLYEINKISHVICIGSEEDREICESTGAEFIQCDNIPLGAKWNMGYLAAKERKPDAVLHMGSSNLVSDNWIPLMTQFIEKHMMAGKPDFNILHWERREILRWWGYPKQKFKFKHRLLPKAHQAFLKAGGRAIEPVGLGRLLRADFLDAYKWQPFHDEAQRGLDMLMMKRLSDIQGSYMLVKDPSIQGLKITSDKWSNINTFDAYKTFDTVERIITPIEFLSFWFRDVLDYRL